MFATMRRKRRSAMMKQELGQSVDHFKRAANLAAQETSATVGPKINAAKDKVQPAVSQAKGAASSGWESAVATLTPLIVSASDNARQAGKTVKVSKRRTKADRKHAKKLEKSASKALGRKQRGRRRGKLVGIALAGVAVGAGAAYVVRKRKAAQWDEYDPSAPVAAPAVDTESARGADDAAFEPTDSPTTNSTITSSDKT